LVTRAERFIGKGMELSIYDPDVQLARLKGANRRYIERTIPHIARLMSDSLEDLVASSEVLIVGLNDAETIRKVRQFATDSHVIIDLVRMPDNKQQRGRYEGVCW
jgi:GDP-mannose 6-dehydrogenase